MFYDRFFINLNIQFFANSSDESTKDEKDIQGEGTKTEESKSEVLSQNDATVTPEVAKGDSEVQSDENNVDKNLQSADEKGGESDEDEAPKSIGYIILSNLFDIIEVFSYSLALMVFAFLFIVKFVTVDGSSMMTTLKNEDRLIICDLFYTPDTGDVIVLNYEPRDELLVKRVIGIAGDTIKIDFDTWEVWVNGEYMQQPYLKDNPEIGKEPMDKGYLIDVDENNTITFTVEEGKVFVMGDNRNHSSDSRVFGQMDADEILGKVIFRVYPFETVGAVK